MCSASAASCAWSGRGSRMRRRGRQSGVAMLVVAVVVMGAALIIVKTLNASTWKADRLRITQLRDSL